MNFTSVSFFAQGAPGFWLVAYAFAACVSLGGLFRLAFKPGGASGSRVRVPLFLLVVLTAIPAADLLGELPDRLIGTWLVAVRVAIVAAAALAATGCFWMAHATVAGSGRRVRPAFVVTCAALVASAWSGYRVYHCWTGASELEPADVQRVSLSEATSVHAATDRGTPIRLFKVLGPAGSTAPRSGHDVPPFALNVIETAPPDNRYGSHGWVFAGGQYHIESAIVERILDENGYQSVDDPRVGDVVVYRGPGGQPVHTGLVKAIGEAGFVLVESKWGYLGRYLHEAKQPTNFGPHSFYRSAREGHLLKGLGAPSVAKNGPRGRRNVRRT